MPRKKKDGRFINYYMDRTIYERLERFADDKAQTMTNALERILDEYLSKYESEMARQVRYCPNCRILVNGIRCGICGKRWLEEPKEEDYCFLVEKEPLWAGVLEDCLKQNEIPYITQNTMGAGFTSKAGMLLERIRFYVPYCAYTQAKDVEHRLFSQDVETKS